MPSTDCHILTYWTNINDANDVAIKLAVNMTDEIDWGELTQPDAPQSGDPAVCRGIWDNTNNYATLTAATCPTLSPATCHHFILAYKTTGGDPLNTVSNYDEPLGSAGLTNLLDFLAQWHPAVRTAVAATVTAATTHQEQISAVIMAINPNATLRAAKAAAAPTAA